MHDAANGLTTVKSELSITLTRLEMGAFFECRVESEALEATVRNLVKIDLQGDTPHCSIFTRKKHICALFFV